MSCSFTLLSFPDPLRSELSIMEFQMAFTQRCCLCLCKIIAIPRCGKSNEKMSPGFRVQLQPLCFRMWNGDVCSSWGLQDPLLALCWDLLQGFAGLRTKLIQIKSLQVITPEVREMLVQLALETHSNTWYILKSPGGNVQGKMEWEIKGWQGEKKKQIWKYFLLNLVKT